MSLPLSSFATLVELLQWRAASHPDRLACVYLVDGERPEFQYTYADLDQQARKIAAQLQQVASPKDRALLLYPSGLDYVAAFWGCLYGDIIAVPVYPPDPARLERMLTRLVAIVKDARPTVVLTTALIQQMAQMFLGSVPELASLTWIATDELPLDLAEQWQPPDLSGESLAFLQYTSGSTGNPKGVMVSHRNLIQNELMVQDAFESYHEPVFVTWLPLYHDMGLIGNLIHPLFAGGTCYIISPQDFLQKPLRWLKAVSRYRAEVSGAPNFGYELCIRRVTEADFAELDLSHWKIAFNGAEPIRTSTMTRFYETFAPYGFRWNANFPCYGLAEATVFVTGTPANQPPVIGYFDADELANGRVRVVAADDPNAQTLVGSGQKWRDSEVRIVDPDTYHTCPAGVMGEIWLAGPHIAAGYWQRPDVTEQTFAAQIADAPGTPYLRTGDLGFVLDGELYVTGRIKDMLIIQGRNVYPHDLEETVEMIHPAMRPGSSAAFGVEVDEQERVVIVQEVSNKLINGLDLDVLIGTIRQRIVEEHQLQPYAIVLIEQGTIHKTTSGKIQRGATRHAYLDQELSVLALWTMPPSAPAVDAPPPAGQSAAEIERWMAAQLAARLGLAPQAIDPHAPFAYYGLDSREGLELLDQVGGWLGQNLAPTLLFNYPSIAALAGYLGQRDYQPQAQIGAAVALNEPIAIIGMAGRFPGAETLDDFWEMLRSGREGVSEVPDDRWDLETFYSPEEQAAGRMNTRWGGFLDQIDLFDPLFFGISPREAIHMDPQQRLLLETAWQALEDAGLLPAQLSGSPTGVFIGVSTMDYGQMQFQDAALVEAYSGTGSAASIAANRLSYLLDLHGPSLAVDTACSSSLVALSLACDSLRAGTSTLALVGGVNVILAPQITVAFSQARMMSPDGHCKTFDADANGYVRSEGCGVIVLKRLSEAVRDGDDIWAVIRGAAVNQDGRTNGLTAPNGRSQEAVIRQAWHNAGVTADQVGYIEAHGTGTPLGDPIEFESLANVMRYRAAHLERCVIGSVKTNVGHLEAAAGIVGLIKAALALKHQAIPPHLHLRQINPYIDLENSRLSIATDLTPWRSNGASRIAGVSSFGFGGTNSHVILEEAPPASPADPQRGREAYLLPLSAQQPDALYALAGRYLALLEREAANLYDLTAGAALRRTHYDYRVGLVGDSVASLRAQLDALYHDRPALTRRRYQSDLPTVFIFSGQGPQWWAMGRALYAHEPVYRVVIDEVALALGKYADWSLVEELHRAEGDSRLGETAIAQPAIFALQAGLAALWQSWGIEPAAVIGHSVGEIAAAYVAGVYDLETAVWVVYHRARLMQRVTGLGKMVSIEAAPEVVAPLIEGHPGVTLGAINSPTSCVLSGDEAELRALIAPLEAQGIDCRWLHVDYAFHSPQMTPLQPELEAALAGLQPHPARIPLISTLDPAGAVTLDAAYWAAQIRAPVRFAEAVQRVLTDVQPVALIEVAPHPALLSALKANIQAAGVESVALPSLHRREPETHTLLHSLAQLYQLGVEVKWNGVYPLPAAKVTLPAYPWQRESYWLNVGAAMQPVYSGQTSEPIPDGWGYEIDWQPVKLSAVYPAGGRWLIFAEDGFESVSAALIGRLREDGQTVITVVIGDSYRQSGEAAFILRPGEKQDYQRLLAEVDLTAVSGILHLWNLNGVSEEDQSAGAESLLLLAATLAEYAAAPRLWIVTHGAQTATPTQIAQSVSWGFGRALAQEHPVLFGGLIDLDPLMDASVSAGALWAAAHQQEGEAQLAIRSEAFYAPRLLPVTLNRHRHEFRWRADGAYLITGGLSGIGAQVARWMAQQGARRLILMGRTPMPARAAWSALDPHSRAGQQAALIRDLEALGVSVHLATVDVGDADELEGYLDAYRLEGWPPIRGVIHAAGVVTPRLLIESSVDDLRATLHPKVRGAHLLHRLLGEVDLFVMFSSISSLYFGGGLTAYAAANAYLDALAHQRTAQGQPVLTINWGPWQETGMASDPGLAERFERQGLLSISTSAGINALAQATHFHQDAAQVAIAPVDWRRLTEFNPAARRDGLLRVILKDSESASELTREGLLALPEADRLPVIEGYLLHKLKLAMRLNGSAAIDPQVSLVSLGLDSLVAIELKNRIEYDLRVDIQVTQFLRGLSIRDLAGEIYQQIASGQMVTAAPLKLDGISPAEAQALLADIDKLSDDEIEALLKILES